MPTPKPPALKLKPVAAVRRLKGSAVLFLIANQKVSAGEPSVLGGAPFGTSGGSSNPVSANSSAPRSACAFAAGEISTAIKAIVAARITLRDQVRSTR